MVNSFFKLSFYAVLYLLALQAALAGTITVSSQNCLHLSDPNKQDLKYQTIKAQNGDYDVNLLQEVMRKAELDEVVPGKPGEYLYQASELKGHSSYKEKYVIVYRSTLTALSPPGMTDYEGDEETGFSRPPSGTLLQLDKAKKKYTWFVDYHAIFGKHAKTREDEVNLMKDVYEWYQDQTVGGVKTKSVLLAGDWNQEGDDPGFDNLKTISHIQILPDIETSLNQEGEFSSKYDHLVASATYLVLDDCDLVPLPEGEDNYWFRWNVSDHRGVVCTVKWTS